jgi:rare lipoprotein A
MRRKLLASLTAALLLAGTVAASGPETAKVQKAAAQGPVKPQASAKSASTKAQKTEPKTQNSSAAASKKANAKKQARSRRKHRQVGLASWYGKKFQGHMTASGEPYNMYRLTAAHKELPLGSLIKVTNLRNGKWVIVRVNDRGPYVGNRIVDLSYGAAEILDMRPYGVQKVELELVSPEPVVAGLASNLE